jgi:hypothetical protein
MLYFVETIGVSSLLEKPADQKLLSSSLQHYIQSGPDLLYCERGNSCEYFLTIMCVFVDYHMLVECSALCMDFSTLNTVPLFKR